MKKRWISGLLVIAMLLTMMPVWEVAAEETESIVSLAGEGAVIADGTCGDNLTWVLTEDGVLTISGTGAMTNFSEGDSPWYTKRTEITSVVIEDGVTSIGEDAFYGCAMLTTVTVSETLTQVHYDAFTGCNRLTYAYYDNAKYWGTSDNPYYLLVEAVSQYITEVEVHPDTKVIADDAFHNCYNLTTVSLPEGLTHISAGAFSYCGLTNVTIPESVVWMGDSAFWQCTNLERVDITSLSAWCGITFGFEGNPLTYADMLYVDGIALTELVIPEDVTEVGSYAFYGYNGLISVTIPDHVTTIGEGAFSLCENLSSVSIGNGITRMGNSPFYGCAKLVYTTYGWLNYLGNATNPYALLVGVRKNTYSSYDIHPDTKFIGCNAFYDCDQITSVTLPEGVRGLGSLAFAGCAKLKTVTLPSTLQFIGEEVFSGCNALTTLSIPDAVTEIGKNAFSNCDSLTELILPAGLTHIGEAAFSGCSGLTELVIPAGVTVIGPYMFMGCDNLKVLTLPATLSKIGQYAFLNCNMLEQIVLEDDALFCFSDGILYDDPVSEIIWVSRFVPTELTILPGVQRIEEYAFSNNDMLTQVTLPEGLRYIGTNAFNNCWNLVQVTIPSTVTEMDYNAFSYCTALTTVIFMDGVTTIGDGAFSNCSALQEIVIPGSVISIGEEAFYNCYNLRNLILNEGLQRIEARAFQYCSGLVNLTLPDSLEYAGEAAFGGCNNLTHVEVPEDGMQMGDNVFGSCNNLVYYTYGEAKYLGNSESDYIILVKATNSKMKSYSVHEDTKAIGNGAFYNCINLATVTLPEGLRIIDEDAFSMCDDIKSITIPNSVEIIGNSAFYYCYGIRSMTLPDSLEYIGSLAFYYCNKITSINIPTGVTYIGSSAFSNCTSLQSVHITDLAAWCAITFGDSALMWGSEMALGVSYNLYLNGEKITNLVIPADVTEISASAFSGCVSLTYVTVAAGVERIASCTFANCTALTGITLPESLISIEERAFKNCSAMTDISLPVSVDYVGEYAFSNCDNLSSVSLGGVINMGERAFQNCKSLKTVEIPGSMHEIPAYAFQNCTALLCVDLGDNVYEVGEKAFEKCSQLRCVVMGENLCHVGYYAFDGCSGMWHMLYKGTEAQWETLTFDDGNGTVRLCTRHYDCSGEEIMDLDNKICQLCCMHQFDEGQVTRPTCGEMGYTLYTCSKCGYNYKDAYVNATGLHNYVASEVIAPTCTQSGYTYYCCTGCQESCVGDEVAPLGHVDGEAVREKEVAASCGAAGSYDSVTYCAACEMELSRETIVEPATGLHVYTSEMEYLAPTCTVDGYVVKACDCGATDTVVLPATDHSYSETVTAPTCTEQGYTTYICDICQYTDVSDYVEALGHSYTDITVELTPETDGYTLHTCTACGESYKDHFFVYISGTVTGQEADLGLPITVILSNVATGDIVDTMELTVGESYRFAVSAPNTYVITIRRENAADVVSSVTVNDCSVTKDMQLYIPGDVDCNDVVDGNDAIYLLYYTLFGDALYPLNQPADFDGNGVVDGNDAIYLLYYTLFGETVYPLH